MMITTDSDANTSDVRWKQRFDHYRKAFTDLRLAASLAQERDLTDLEMKGVIQTFEFVHELAWKVLKDYLEEHGIIGLIGSKDTIRQSFQKGLIADGEVWLEMIKARNLTLHTYHSETAKEVARDTLERFYPAFLELKNTFDRILERDKQP
jgi:nucleotidyltransferase substrate binding protein (TIGR01987 family)